MTETKTEPRILLYDIESSLQLAAVFQPGNNDWIKQENMLTERYVISICWQWLGETKIHSVCLLDDPERFAADPTDDTHVLEVFGNVYAQADCTVAHYGDSFDKRYIMTRRLIKGLDPLPPVPSIDTKKIASQVFYFNYNNLNYIGKVLKVGQKVGHSPGLWLDILKGGNSERAIKAIKQMVIYNIGDVKLLKSVFIKLRPYIPNHINRELFGNTGCPRCGSKKVQSRGTHYATTRTYRRWQCMGECKGWFRTQKTDEKSTTKHRVL